MSFSHYHPCGSQAAELFQSRHPAVLEDAKPERVKASIRGRRVIQETK